jgi:xanthine/CO dehydrogenase XdhC/CoxF family maturation factor/CTP:molybdopterin cytidylyltransferase MocA
MSGTLQELVQAYRSLSAAGEDIVLATIIATEGSTYRKAGARMLFARDGRRFGVLAGGSFEDELSGHVAGLFPGGGARIIDMDMPGRGDAAMGRDLLRDGGARIFLQHLSRRAGYAPLEAIARAVAGPAAQVLVTIVGSSDPRVTAGSAFLGGDREPGIPADIAEELGAAAAAVAETGEPILVGHVFGEGELEAFYAPVRPPLSLLLIGATPDSAPVARIARLLGWRVHVADPRGNLSGDRDLGGSEGVIPAPAAALDDALGLEAVDAAVLLTRNFELDCEYLRVLAASPVPYLGLLGSKNRCRRLVETLGAEARRVEGRVHGPVGLAIGAETPEEIALAITAQIQDEYRKRAKGAAEARATREALAGQVHALLLAAGGSRRFGSFKQLLEFRGESLLRRAARMSSEVLEGRVVVVHGPKPNKCQRELSGIDVAHAVNADWEHGVATSLRAGVRALPGDCAAVLVLLCDQPLVGADQIRALLRAWAAAPERIAASAYAETLGVPAVFPRKYFTEMQQLSGDRGAKSVIEANRASVTAVSIPEAALDIDTQEDYASMLKNRQEPG